MLIKPNERQAKEIETIKERTIPLKLSDADVKRICTLAGSVNITVTSLIENFIGDLVGGTYSNGSDERTFARQWFNRCGFDIGIEYSFLQFAIDNFALEEILDLWESIQDAKDDIDYYKEHPEDEDAIDEIPLLNEDIDSWQKELAVIYNEYKSCRKSTSVGSLEDEIQKILKWKKEYESFLGDS